MDSSPSVSDLICLADTSRDQVLSVLQNRFNNSKIYTFLGPILISINPYHSLSIYDASAVDRQRFDANAEPHIFSIAKNAYSSMMVEELTQSIVISGLSGSGKSESTKQCLKFLAEIGASDSNIEETVLRANPVFEAFGNAKTLMNDNSSRFGKYIQVFFDPNGKIQGAQHVTYLLEKIRVTHHREGERGFHIFNQMLKGLSNEMLTLLGLDKKEDFNYLHVSEIEGVDDAEDFIELEGSLDSLGFSKDDMVEVYSILASILHIGQLHFHEKDSSTCEIENTSIVQLISKLLKVSTESLEQLLTMKSFNPGGRVTFIPLRKNQCYETCKALSQLLYSDLFTWIVHKINATTFHGTSKRFIGILDVFGFEDLESNSFEQLCINYTNEKLFSLYIQEVFQKELNVYRSEGIHCSHFEAPSNKNVIELIEGRPYGVLPLLDEVLRFPKPSDGIYLQHLKEHNHLSEKFKTHPNHPKTFEITHFAGPVEYEVENFLRKNQCTVSSQISQFLESSLSTVIKKMIGNQMDQRASVSISKSFSSDLNKLSSDLQKTKINFVKCFQSNTKKLKMTFDVNDMKKQLDYSGVYQAIELRRNGYPHRVGLETFNIRYHSLKVPKGPQNIRDFICNQYNCDDGSVQVGKSLIFMKSGVYQSLEHERDAFVLKTVVFLQRRVRSRLNKVSPTFIENEESRGSTEDTLEISLVNEMNQNDYDKLKQAAVSNDRALFYETIQLRIKSLSALPQLSLKQCKLMQSQVKWTNSYRRIASSVPSLYEFSKRPIHTSLTVFSDLSQSADLTKQSLFVSKDLLAISGDAFALTKRKVLVQNFILRGLEKKDLRDEIYVQIIRQLSENPSSVSKKRTLKLLTLVIHHFPPSAHLFPFLERWIVQNVPKSDSISNVLSFWITFIAGPRESIATDEEMVAIVDGKDIRNLSVGDAQFVSTESKIDSNNFVSFLEDAKLWFFQVDKTLLFISNHESEHIAILRDISLGKGNSDLDSWFTSLCKYFSSHEPAHVEYLKSLKAIRAEIQKLTSNFELEITPILSSIKQKSISIKILEKQRDKPTKRFSLLKLRKSQRSPESKDKQLKKLKDELEFLFQQHSNDFRSIDVRTAEFVLIASKSLQLSLQKLHNTLSESSHAFVSSISEYTTRDAISKFINQVQLKEGFSKPSSLQFDELFPIWEGPRAPLDFEKPLEFSMIDHKIYPGVSWIVLELSNRLKFPLSTQFIPQKDISASKAFFAHRPISPKFDEICHKHPQMPWTLLQSYLDQMDAPLFTAKPLSPTHVQSLKCILDALRNSPDPLKDLLQMTVFLTQSSNCDIVPLISLLQTRIDHPLDLSKDTAFSSRLEDRLHAVNTHMNTSIESMERFAKQIGKLLKLVLKSASKTSGLMEKAMDTVDSSNPFQSVKALCNFSNLFHSNQRFNSSCTDNLIEQLQKPLDALLSSYQKEKYQILLKAQKNIKALRKLQRNVDFTKEKALSSIQGDSETDDLKQKYYEALDKYNFALFLWIEERSSILTQLQSLEETKYDSVLQMLRSVDTSNSSISALF